MRLPVPLRELYLHSVSGLQSLLPAPDNPVWDARDHRQRTVPGIHNVHRDTRSIVFRWLSNEWQAGDTPQVVTEPYAPKELTEEVFAVAWKLQDYFGGTIVKLMLAELKSGGSITPHSDQAPALYLSHRCHLPVITNAYVDFRIDDESFMLNEGIVYEIDNTRMHSVQNKGLCRRVHLICDIM
jgi:hypothetical protein